MRHTATIGLLVTLLAKSFVFAQDSTQTSKPSPELKKQDFFVGTWMLEGTTKSSPFGPGGQKFQSTEQLEWMPGGFFLLVHSYSEGKLAEVTVIGYDQAQKVFTHTTFNSTGKTELWTGTAEGDSWTWTKGGTIHSEPIKERLVIRKKSSDSYSFVVEIKPAAGDGWSTVAEGTGTKTR